MLTSCIQSVNILTYFYNEELKVCKALSYSKGKMVLLHQITQQIHELNALITELEKDLIALDCTKAKLESLIQERNDLLKLKDELILEGCLLG